jgi:hypothetical protein
VARPLIHALWAGKWDRAAPVVEMLSGVLPVYVLTAAAAAMLEARGLWRPNTILHAISGLGTVAAAWVGASLGGLWQIALAAAAFRLVFSLFQGMTVSAIVGLPVWSFVQGVAPPFLASLLIAASVWTVGRTWLSQLAPLAQVGAMSAVYVPLTAIIYAICFPVRMRELWETFALRSPVPKDAPAFGREQEP